MYLVTLNRMALMPMKLLHIQSVGLHVMQEHPNLITEVNYRDVIIFHRKIN